MQRSRDAGPARQQWSEGGAPQPRLQPSIWESEATHAEPCLPAKLDHLTLFDVSQVIRRSWSSCAECNGIG
ncbi:unnamed protein product [Cylicocyclus nassatus]|uniref:Uncharacterized protein n=1 Tax=Cylicocyclus nassatus TaxID=53992 RepID=A0AA36M3F4_CYLNA|nr:unnamed protein product [Cylicocyclus nassatus]